MEKFGLPNEKCVLASPLSPARKKKLERSLTRFIPSGRRVPAISDSL